MNKCTLNIWGRSFDIDIIFDHYMDEEILESQKVACNMFLQKGEALLDEALAGVKQYCLDNNHSEIGEDVITNIFKFVKPKTLFIKRTPENDHKVALICAYKFNLDDGLAIVFRNEKYYEIGTENIII